MAPSLAGTVHPGADDNASGTAGVIELARWFSHEPQHKRGILFLTFAGEELGLLGSSYYVNHPVLPLEDAVAMINMDMIGRIRDRKVYVGGVGTGTTFAELLKQLDAQARFRSRPHRASRLRIERSHLVHHQTSAGAVLLLRPARRLSQAERHLGQDRCARCRSAARSGRRRHRSPDRRLARARNSSASPKHSPRGEVANPHSGKVSGSRLRP